MSILMHQPRSAKEIGRPTAVVRVDRSFMTVAARPIATGSVILRLEGRLVETPSMTSVQVGKQRHIDLPLDADLERALDCFHWRFLNHSCHPNSHFRGTELVALDEISAWEEVTFDYNTTEFELARPFDCRCGAATCTGEVVMGYAHLDLDARARRAPFLAAHLCT